ncbi:MAG TPA: branched-chain amino acid aminotransferase [Alphaproteobacteria bacterium]|nr:branched-chain amino acid aminotransferase [Alphaproteobacteria bacterium]
MSKFKLIPNPSPVPAEKRKQLLADPGFGRLFTDHMAVAKWNAERGWHDPEIRAYAPLSLDPASSVLHYAQEIFEGAKAYRRPDGKIGLFRLDQNAKRFAKSATRMQMPPLPEDLFIESVTKLVETDKNWIPEGNGSLYLRPFMFGSAAFLGVKPSSEYLYLVIASPVGSYFAGGKDSVKIWVSENISRAGPGGTGQAKCGGNYAASLAAQAEAYKNECDQVIFLDSIEHKWMEELGGMNIFFVFENGEIVTPPLSETILAGITRDSIIQLAKSQGLKVSERKYDFDSWRADAQSGKLLESFACGTAAVITPIGEVRSKHGNFTIGNGGAGQMATKLRSSLLDIQYGRAPDPFNWTQTV